MVSRQLLLAATAASLLLGLLGVYVYLQSRAARCLAVPLLAPELLPNADLRLGAGKLPEGWGGTATISATTFTVLPGGRSLQVLGIASYAQSPEVRPVRPGQRYCFVAQALTDSPAGSATRVQLEFQWLDAAGALARSDRTIWQDVALWRPEAPPEGWSPIGGAFAAPQGAAALRVRVRPSSDDRVYLDQMHLRAGGERLETRRLESGGASPSGAQTPSLQSPIAVQPWPSGKRAAVSFSFDWETAMGGLVHSRSLGDPNFSEDYLLRGARMREGITTTLEIFRPYGVRATYYATGYNFLLGNPARRTFMGDPTFAWATMQNGWTSDSWRTTPWFARDPYGSVGSDPAWYFGDLVPALRREGQAIESHTFSHLYGGLASLDEWRRDFAAWNEAASEQGVAPATSLAFPWSGSDGMSDAAWFLLEQQGVRSVTRTSGYNQSNLFPLDARGLVAEPRCLPLPGHQAILACPDFYLTPERAPLALEQLERTIMVSGTIDLWAHTEEVVSPEQVAAWRQVVRAAATDQRVWVAPLAEIAAWQSALSLVRVKAAAAQGAGQAAVYSVTNGSAQRLEGLTLQLPASSERVMIGGQEIDVTRAGDGTAQATLDLAAGQTIEVMVWPA
jgi:hypothetical protein